MNIDRSKIFAETYWKLRLPFVPITLGPGDFSGICWHNASSKTLFPTPLRLTVPHLITPLRETGESANPWALRLHAVNADGDSIGYCHVADNPAQGYLPPLLRRWYYPDNATYAGYTHSNALMVPAGFRFELMDDGEGETSLQAAIPNLVEVLLLGFEHQMPFEVNIEWGPVGDEQDLTGFFIFEDEPRELLEGELNAAYQPWSLFSKWQIELLGSRPVGYDDDRRLFASGSITEYGELLTDGPHEPEWDPETHILTPPTFPDGGTLRWALRCY
jgi:hypothetical protein